MYNSNPFMSVKTPQQYQQELNQLQQQYQNQYNQLMQSPKLSPNCFGWRYIDDGVDINSAEVPTNGSPFLFVGNGVMYVKKFVNGQTYIQAYSFAPINNNGEPPTNKQEEDKSGSNDLKTALDKIIANQQEMNCRLSALEGTKEKVNAEVVNPFKENANE